MKLRNRVRTGVIIGLVTAAGLCGAGPVFAQDDRPSGEPADSLAVVSDTAAVPTDSLIGLVGPLADSLQGRLRPEPEFKKYPDQLKVPVAEYASQVWDWSLDEILDSNALNLLDLLVLSVPGFTPIRVSYFGGPHYLQDGPLGAGFVDLIVDGQPVVPVAGAQIDLAGIQLANLRHLRISRTASGWRIEATTIGRDRRDAYSRISAGTGDPDLVLLRGVYANGLGQKFTVATSIDLNNSINDQAPVDRFGFWAKLAWIPGNNGAGVRLQYRSESLDRTVFAEEEVGRRDVSLQARGNLSRDVQVDAFAGSSRFTTEDSTLSSVSLAGLGLTATRGPTYGRVGFEIKDSPAFPRLSGTAALGVRPIPWLGLELEGGAGSWDRFDTWDVRGGAVASGGLPLDLRVAAEASTGRRGASYAVSQTADTTDFTQVAADVGARLGPFSLGGRLEYQDLSRQLSYGFILDPDQEAGGPATVMGYEATIDGPIFPLGMILHGVEPIRVRGSWRYSDGQEGDVLLFTPGNLGRAEIYFLDDFFETNLRLRVGFTFNYRTSMLAPVREPGGSRSVQTVPGYTEIDWNLMVQILSVRVVIRVENLTAVQQQDVPALPWPVNRYYVGIKWEFLN
jgi:hypothetical protein